MTWVWAQLSLLAGIVMCHEGAEPLACDMRADHDPALVRRPRVLLQTKAEAAGPSFEAFLDPSKAHSTSHATSSAGTSSSTSSAGHAASSTGTHSSTSSTGDVTDGSSVATVGTTELIPFCSSPHRPVWERFCAHWSKALEVNAIQNGSSICCSSLPEPCGASHTCSNEATCLVPSCNQEDWYLHNIEQHSDEAFSIFGLDTEAFRQCGFTMEEKACGNKPADFGVTEASIAALMAFVKLDSADFEATAWEVVNDLVVASETSDDNAALVESIHRRAIENGNARTKTADLSLNDKSGM